jgi:hypothetical protein
MMKLYHYYEKSVGPFHSISDLPDDEANRLLDRIRKEKPEAFISKRPEDYVAKRRHFEGILREEFLKKGGLIERETPHYFVVEAVPFFEKWYDQTAFVEIDAKQLDLRTVSFTYGDSHPTFSGKVKDGKEYRNRLYTYDEIFGIIEKYGLPQDWNPDFKFGPECYVEVQVWSDRGLEPWVNQPLWHGSPYLLDKLVPQQAYDTGFEQGCQLAVYATSKKEMAICFALGCEENQPGTCGKRTMLPEYGNRMVFEGCHPKYGSKGYLYQLDPKDFIHAMGSQWVCPHEVTPVKRIEINVDDYLDLCIVRE